MSSEVWISFLMPISKSLDCSSTSIQKIGEDVLGVLHPQYGEGSLRIQMLFDDSREMS